MDIPAVRKDKAIAVIARDRHRTAAVDDRDRVARGAIEIKEIDAYIMGSLQTDLIARFDAQRGTVEIQLTVRSGGAEREVAAAVSRSIDGHGHRRGGRLAIIICCRQLEHIASRYQACNRCRKG